MRVFRPAVQTGGAVAAEQLTTGWAAPFDFILSNECVQADLFDQGDVLQAALAVLGAVAFIEVGESVTQYPGRTASELQPPHLLRSR
jgi:hypothetical protein